MTVFVLGRTVSGARRWIHLGPLTVQPSELFKLIFVLTLAWALTVAPGRSRFARGALIGTFAARRGAVRCSSSRQPDLGTALVLLPVLGAVLVGVGVRLRVLGALALAGRRRDAAGLARAEALPAGPAPRVSSIRSAIRSGRRTM